MSRKAHPARLAHPAALLAQTAWAAAPPGSSQLGNGLYNTVSQAGEFEIAVPGRTTVFQGRGELIWGFAFSESAPDGYRELASFLLAGALPVTGEMEAFGEDWLSTAQYLHRYADSRFGDLIQFISFDRVSAGPDSDVYVIFMVLQNDRRRMDATICYRFEKSYYAVYLGIDNGDMPEMFRLTKQAAQSFSDNTAAPYTANPEILSGERMGGEDRQFPVADALGVLWDYARWEFADQPT